MRHLLPLKYIDAVARSGSIRKAAEELALTPSALNRRILSMEEELSVALFERHSTGVRLNTAGELFIHHIRSQMADFERVRSRIADLSGLRLGHVRLAVTPETVRGLLPDAIARYRQAHPGVTFEVTVLGRDEVNKVLSDLDADIAIAFEPSRLAEFHTALEVELPVHCLVHENHGLAARKTVRFHEVCEHPLLVPPRGNGLREMLEAASARLRVRLYPAVQSDDHVHLRDLASCGDGVAFGPAIGQPQNRTGLIARPIDPRDVPPGHLFLGHLRDRALPVAAARFLEELRAALGE